ncbi:Auxin-induced protein AUX22 [Hibiscus syriacus]|uniref:Auxin-responsive protein n=1 Tax=Hibiscus syriacus TaxID=106335 RepID=A0A6A2WFC5_HIBSY|nr:Auxin-induced protein AUX22 [Hibiscus syriacus]
MAKEGLGFEITELRLGLSGGGEIGKNEKKRVFSEISEEDENGKSQVVGWPPVFSMDGAPFLRKIDLALHKGYSDLATALEKLFGEALRDADSCELVSIYEDNDVDWMLAGDVVPWE